MLNERQQLINFMPVFIGYLLKRSTLFFLFLFISDIQHSVKMSENEINILISNKKDGNGILYTLVSKIRSISNYM